MLVRRVAFAIALGCAASPALVPAAAPRADGRIAVTASLTFSGQANIFGAGQSAPPAPAGGGGGVQPAVYSFAAGEGQVLTFSSVTGRVTCCNGMSPPPYNGPAGGTTFENTDIPSVGGISGVRADKTMFVVGVFLGSGPPTGAAPPEATFTKTPQLQQVFYVGDGRVGAIAVPAGATRLFLGFADAYAFKGRAGAYSDNGGSITAQLTIAKGSVGAKPLRLSWRMPDRFGQDRDADGLIDYPTTPAAVQPFSWPVTVFVRGCDPQVTYAFASASGSLRSEPDPDSGACAFRVFFPREGRYTLKASATLRDGAKAEGTTPVTVQDWLVVGIGDSAGSGEGVPDEPGPRNPLWELERCHRSARSFEALTAARIEDASVLTSVTFVHVACSGAGIKEGAVGPYFGIAPGGANEPLLAQVADVKRLVGGREVDAVIASIGVNDVGFGAIVKFCVSFPVCMARAYQGRRTLDDVVQERLSRLPALYAQLAGRLRSVAPAARVYLTEYFDSLRDDVGAFCDAIARGMDAEEARWAYERVLVPLNAEVRRAAGAHGWRFVGGAQGRFHDHGYCAGDESWIVTLSESLLNQGDIQGTLHPNREGHEQLASIVYPVVRRDLYPGGKARAPR